MDEKLELANDTSLQGIKTTDSPLLGLWGNELTDAIRKFEFMGNPSLAKPLQKPPHPFAKFKGG